MAGTKIKDQFRELISPFLKFKMDELKKNFGEESKEYLSIARQYIYNPLEKNIEANLEKLNAIDGINCVNAQGAFYLIPNFSSTGMKSAEFCER